MKQKNILGWSIIALLGTFGFLGASEYSVASVNSETQRAATRTGAAKVAEIGFAKESTELSDGAKRDLQSLILDARTKGEIKEIRVAAWADQEYPQKGVALAESQVDLAKRRAENVQAYLETSLNVKGVSIMNMAERPSGIQNALNTTGAKTKNTLEKSGAAPTRSNQTGLFGLKGKASQAVVMVYYK